MRFLRFWLRARTIFDLHSPLAYAFAEAVLEDRRWYYVFSEAETMRGRWLSDLRSIRVQDFGAGSQRMPGLERKIADLARHAATPAPFCRCLFRIVRFSRSERLLELGSSLGISTLYLEAAAPEGKLITIEGCAETARLARQTLRKAGSRAELRTGPFSGQLPQALEDLQRLDFLYLDGDHSLEGTLRYLEQCRPYTHENSVWVIGDIHWSADMEKAWKQVQAFPEVRMTIDLFGMGVVFFTPAIRHPAHYLLLPSLWKPWRRGRWGGL